MQVPVSEPPCHVMSCHAFVPYFLGCFSLIVLIYHGELQKVQYFMTRIAKLFVFTMFLFAILTAAGLVAEIWSLW